MNHPHLNIIIVLLTAILVAILLSDCASMHGLHSENALRNKAVRWQGRYENKDNVVK